MNFSAKFNPLDPLQIEQQLTPDEKSLMLKVRDFSSKELLPITNEAFFAENRAVDAVKILGQLKLFGGDIAHQFGGPQISPVAYGLIARELEKIDSGYRTIYSVMGSLVMKSIYLFGNDSQKKMYLSDLNCGKQIGAFALTEADAGSDPSSIQTTARKTANGYILNGSKRWIGLAPYADILIVWAKCDDQILRAFIVDKNTPGIKVEQMINKLSLRVAPQGAITFERVVLPDESLLAKSNGLASAFSCLNYARYGIAWGALGAAEDCLEQCLTYVKQRKQFNVALASKQLVQQKLVNMQVEIALGLNACLNLGRLIETNQASFLMINMLKYNSTGKALAIARQARDLLGGNGILEDYHIMRHMVNLEAVNTYEGTSDIHILTLGRALTGHSAF